MLPGAHANKKYLLVAGALLTLFLFHVAFGPSYTSRASTLDLSGNTPAKNVLSTDEQSGSTTPDQTVEKALAKPSPAPRKPSKYAYVIFLSDDVVPESQTNMDEDLYFVATRILLYQLIHAPETRTKLYDVVVVVTPSVREEKRQRIRDDGAIIHELEHLDNGWIKAGEHRWDSQMQKYRVFQMTQYERVLLMDSDEVLQANIDGVFEDPAAVVRKPNTTGITPLKGEAPYPEEYLIGAMGELAKTHKYPPEGPEDFYRNGGYFNAGFMLFKPSQAVFEYLVAFTKIENTKKEDGSWLLFDPAFSEQELLNYVHRRDGPMPWSQLDPLWMLHLGVAADMDKKPKGLHQKWWTEPEQGGPSTKLWLETWKWRMEAFWHGREGKD
jgi:alpha-N-acetylglucosamine transferase